MNFVVKTIAAASLMGSVAAPAFADAHMNASMTCAEWKALDAEDRMTVASMAIAELDDNTMGSVEGVATATEDTGESVTADEATDSAEQGSVVDSTTKSDEAREDGDMSEGADMARMTDEAMENFVVACDQNLDQMVSEAAAGLNSSR